ncbi:MAG: hypothetical protein OXC68_15530 [Aestuariivita sp.]|nr:hypothetical protein [Aestuariivita sp.]
MKISNLHKQLPIMGMSAGLANFKNVSMSTLMKIFRKALTEKIGENKEYTLEIVTKAANSVWEKIYKKTNLNSSSSVDFEFWIGGYAYNATRGEIWKIEIRNGKLLEPIQLCGESDPYKIIWGGQVQALQRLILGYDPRVKFVAGMENLTKEQHNQIRSLEAPLIHPLMPVKDAIDLADFLV